MWRVTSTFVVLLLSAAAPAAAASQPADDAADVLVYGATGGGCIAAIAASRSGAERVVLLSQTRHVGGMLTGGLMHTDSANGTVIQGITREFFVRTEQQYPGRPIAPGRSWLFESHVGERVLQQMLDDRKVMIEEMVA